MNYCDFNIDSNLEQNCAFNGKIGYEELLIFNTYAFESVSFTDLQSGAFTFENPGNVVTSITPRTVPDTFDQPFSIAIVDARAVKFNGSSKSMNTGTTFNTTPKTLQFVIKNNGASVANAITKLKNGEFVVAAKRPGPYPTQDASAIPGVDDYNASMIELFGIESKMRVTACEQILSGDDADASYYGGWLVTMQCTELSDAIYYIDNATSSTGIEASNVETAWANLASLDWNHPEP